jgi:DNA-directed RNA polymerase subunit RPC12/RpoP
MAATCPYCGSKCEYDNNGKLRCVNCGKTVKQ